MFPSGSHTSGRASKNHDSNQCSQNLCPLFLIPVRFHKKIDIVNPPQVL